MSSATASVLSTAELLEQILLNLPARDVLTTALRLNHTVRNLITHSPSLQQHLFFSPSAPSSAALTPNPILSATFPPFFPESPSFVAGALIAYGYVLLDHELRERHDFRSLMKLDWYRSEARTEAYRRKEASWRRMLVCQPPLREFKLRKSAEYDGGTEVQMGVVEVAAASGGLRMGTLWDLVEGYLISHSPESRFEVSWTLPSSPDDEGIDGNETKQRLGIRLSHTFQCDVDGNGNGFKVRDFEREREIEKREGRRNRRIEKTLEWVFRSEGFLDLEKEMRDEFGELEVRWRLRDEIEVH